jgi:hypothetical protein
MSFLKIKFKFLKNRKKTESVFSSPSSKGSQETKLDQHRQKRDLMKGMTRKRHFSTFPPPTPEFAEKKVKPPPSISFPRAE